MGNILSRLLVLACFAVIGAWLVGTYNPQTSEQAAAESNAAHYRTEGLGPKLVVTLVLE